MVKYNAVVSYPVKKDGHNKNHLVTVYYYEKNVSDEKIIELADLKVNSHSKDLIFSIEGNGIILKKNHIKKTIFQ